MVRPTEQSSDRPAPREHAGPDEEAGGRVCPAGCGPDDLGPLDTSTALHPRFHGALHLTVMGPSNPGATQTQPITTHRYPLAHDPKTPPLHTVVLDLLHHAPPGSHLRLTYVPSTPAGSRGDRDG